MSPRRYVGSRKFIFAASAAVITAGLLASPSAADAATIGNVWSVVNSPNVTTGLFATNALLGVAAGSDTDVWAVGFENKTGFDPGGDRPLIEHWNGTSWSVSLVGTQNAELTSVSTDSANDAWAVGNVESNQTLLAEHWNGSVWNAVPMPMPTGAISARVEGVTALSPGNAWAVGTFTTNELTLSLIEHWDGTRWSAVPDVPRQVSVANELRAITAISANDIWAVGQFDQGGVSPQAQLLLHWDGAGWSLSRSAVIAAGESNASPVAVTAASSTDVWAVGGADVTGRDGVTSQRPFAIHWNGVQWTEAATPAPATPSAAFAFTAVAALSRNDVWAVGLNAGNAVIEHWNGSGWGTAATPVLGADGSSLQGLTRSGTTSLWAVGDNRPRSGLISQTLTLRTTNG
jgi:hypothetical protein